MMHLLDMYAATTPRLVHTTKRGSKRRGLAPRECPFCGDEIVQAECGRLRWTCGDPACVSSYSRYYNRWRRLAWGDAIKRPRMRPVFKLVELARCNKKWAAAMKKVEIDNPKMQR